jgi:hypothetical protein
MRNLFLVCLCSHRVADVYIHAVSQDRRSSVTDVPQSHGDPVVNEAIFSEDRVAADRNSTKMVDSESPSELYFAEKLNACSISETVFQDLVEKGEKASQASAGE